MNETPRTCIYMSRHLSLWFPAGPPGSSGSPPASSDEALAMQLQQELDREAMRAQTVDLIDGGLFFCHICHKDLTHMTPEGRTQHVNRCARLLWSFVFITYLHKQDTT